MTQKAILFVDDNENVTSALKRMLRPWRSQWQMFFVSSGIEALALMEQQEIDLIISDMMMPEMRGDQLLKEVAKHHPATVRMILSGYADEATLKSALEVAHQYLTKPCTPETLTESINQIFHIQECINNPRIIQAMGEISHLPSLPEIYHQLNRAIADEDSTASSIAAIFAKDMALSAKLLHLVNSPYFGMNRKISSLTEAVNLIGFKKLTNLVLNVYVEDAFPVHEPKAQRIMEYLWQDAMRTAELAQRISLAEGQLDDRPDQAYLGGLLHNMGLLIFLSMGGNRLDQLINAVKTSDTPIVDLEQQIFGLTRYQGAAYVLSLWKIPGRVIEAILLQHTPNVTDYSAINALAAVHISACLLKPAVTQEYGRLFELTLNLDYIERIGLTDRIPAWQKLSHQIIEQFNPEL